MVKDQPVTIREVYELITQMKNEINQSIQRLEERFIALESGRLSKLELDFANLQGKTAIVSSVIAIAVSIGVAIFTYFLSRGRW